MQTAIELLNFTFSPIRMKEAALASFPVYFEKSHDSKINRLIKLTQDIGARTFIVSEVNLIPQVFRKFKKISKSGDTLITSLTKRELRTLTFSLSYSENQVPAIYKDPSELNLVFRLLTSSWRDSYLIGLTDCYLKNWGVGYSLSMQKLGSFICDKLNRYSGARKVLSSMKLNIKFFDNQRGDLELGYTLALKNKSINEATTYLGLSETWFAYPYFSRVILAYYEKQKREIRFYIDNLNTALHIHNNLTTNKRVVSKIVIQADIENDSSLKDKVKLLAINLIGDPSNISDWWPFDGATDQEKNDIGKARAILNEWMTQQFINVFFEKCINDPRRKKFWLKLSKHISAFKVHGSSYTYRELKDDPRVSEFVDNRFQVTHGQKKISAFFMHVKDYKLIEFSDPGYAFNAYKQSNHNAPSMDKTYSNVDKLRDGDLPYLVRKNGRTLYDYSNEGKLRHHDGVLSWEDVFTAWLKEKVGIDV